MLIATAFFAYIAFRPSQPAASAPTATRTVNASPASQSALVEQGKQVFLEFHCNVCHTTNGGRAAGPTLKGLAGSLVTLNNGQVVTADAKYLRTSIVNPDIQIVSGYGPDVMSAALDPFTAKIQQDDNVNALVAYIQSLK